MYNMDMVSEKLFRFGMWWRVIYGSAKVFVGLIFLRIIGTPFTDLLYKIARHELIEDPNDRLVGFLGNFLGQHPYQITYFLTIYFFFWGAVDILLSLGLIKHKLWVFPLAMVTIILFTFYSIFRFFNTYSLILLSTIIFDFFIIYLIWYEYIRLKSLSPLN